MSEEVPQISFNPQACSLRDLMELEKHFGLKLNQLIKTFQQGPTNEFSMDNLSANVLAGLTFLVARQRDKSVTADAVMDMSLDEMQETLTGAKTKIPDPTSPSS